MTGLTVLAAENGEEGGFHAPGLGLFEWPALFSIGPLEVTKPMVMAFLGALIVVAFFWSAFGRPALVPQRMQNLGEIGYLFVRNEIARGIIGKEGDRYVPLLVSLFFFIWIMNLMSILPVLQFPVTSHIAFPAALALMVWVLFMYLGIKHQGLIGYFKNMMFPPGLPLWIYPLLGPIELISTVFIRPFTHAVRLFANMFAGHLLIALFSVSAYYFLIESPGILSVVGILGFLLTIVMTGFEMLIQALQAFIFTLLAAVYISSSLEAQH